MTTTLSLKDNKAMGFTVNTFLRSEKNIYNFMLNYSTPLNFFRLMCIYQLWVYVYI